MSMAPSRHSGWPIDAIPPHPGPLATDISGAARWPSYRDRFTYSPGRAHSGPYVAGPGRRQEKALIALALALAGALLGYILYPEVITQRGASFRPEIWADALRQISEHPWLGHGYDHPMRIVLSNGMLLADPHNIELGVLFAGGIIGLLLWVAIYALAFGFSSKTGSLQRFC